MPKFKTRAEYEKWKASQRSGKKEAQEDSPAPKTEDTLALHLREQKIIKLITKLYLEGKTIVEIVAILNKEGYRTRTGAFWNFATVEEITEYVRKKTSD